MDCSKLVVSTSPHIRTDDSTQKIMLRVIIALLPVTVYAVVIFGVSAAYVLVASIAGALLGELVMQAGRKMPVTLTDLSALLTGLLLALTLPAHLPWWIALVAGLHRHHPGQADVRWPRPQHLQSRPGGTGRGLRLLDLLHDRQLRQERGHRHRQHRHP